VNVIQLRVPADPNFVGLVRSNIPALAAHTKLGLDAIYDLQLGLDEAFSIVIAHNPTSGDVNTEFTLSDDGLTVTITGPTGGQLPEENGFSWTILNSVASGVNISTSPEGSISVTLHSQVVASA